MKKRLRDRAAAHGRSMAEEAREILQETLYREQPETFMEIATELFGPKRGFELPPVPGFSMREPPNFDE